MLSQKFDMAYVFACMSFEPECLDCYFVDTGANAVIFQSGREGTLGCDETAMFNEYVFKEFREPNIDISSDRTTKEQMGQFTEETKIGGVPTWIQGNDTPTCQLCGSTMDFFAQLSATIPPDKPNPYIAAKDQLISRDTAKKLQAGEDVEIHIAQEWDSTRELLPMGDAGVAYLFKCSRECNERAGAFLVQW